MKSSLRLGKILGITIQLHFSWFIIFALFTYSFAVSFLEDHSLWVRVAAGLFTSLLLFGSVLAHELAHSLVAIRNGIQVKSITLFILGGVAQITREAARPKTELLIALAGPLCSLLLAGIFGLIWFLVWGSSQQEITFDNTLDNPVFWLAWINLILALFNLIPGFPLDGGRVLRAIVWQSTGNYRRASRIASLAGRGVAYLFIGAGITMVVVNMFDGDQNPFGGIWLAFIGLFLHYTATASYRQVELREAVRGLTARSVMDTHYVAVPPSLNLRALVQSYVALTGRRDFVVAEERRLQGMLTFDSIESVPQSRWDTTRVGDVMVPADKVISADPEEEALSVLERMDEHSINEMPVVKDRVVLGIIVRQKLLQFMRLRSGLRG